MIKCRFHINAEIYPQEALLKAAFVFIDQYYVYLSKNGTQFCVELTTKDKTELPEDIAEQFKNELLLQTVRYQVYKQTHVLREILMARAMASTMVMERDPIELVEAQHNEEKLDSILEDWFIHES